QQAGGTDNQAYCAFDDRLFQSQPPSTPDFLRVRNPCSLLNKRLILRFQREQTVTADGLVPKGEKAFWTKNIRPRWRGRSAPRRWGLAPRVPSLLPNPAPASH